MNYINFEDFNITEFSKYKSIEGQYTNSFIKTSHCVKLLESNDTVTVAVSESYVTKSEILLKVHFPKKINYIKVSDSDFAEFIGKYVDIAASSNSKNNSNDEEFRLEDINSEAPVVNIINAICLEAIRRKASDIHIQGTKTSIKVRLRIDGILQTVHELDKSIYDNLVSRIKVMANLNVMENRLCQDGRMSVQVADNKLDFRVSIVPSVYGQNIVLRLFNSNNNDLSLSELGFSKENLKQIENTLKVPHGLILVTGPTGSGKTTTLHAMLREMDKEHFKIVTIEDPVELVLEGIEQIQVNDEIGLSFSNILRRILRQDPDIIMVGEIRDKETAELAIRSAITGHLILSTLHTNDSISTITRLKNLGIENYLISGVLKASIAQRLVRKVCKDCSGHGCNSCNFTGYNGRTAVSEVFLVDNNVSEMIEKGTGETEIRKYLTKKNFVSLKEDGAIKLQKKITTKDEIIREGLL